MKKYESEKQHENAETRNEKQCFSRLSTIMRIMIIIEFGPPSGAASNLGLTIVTFADFSDYYGDDGDSFYNYNGHDVL